VGAARSLARWLARPPADLSYFANVFGRTAVQVSFPVLQAGSGLTHAMTASLLSAGAIAQVFGKLINASVISSLGAFKSFILNLGLQMVAYVVMAAPIGGAFNYPRFMAGWVMQMWAASSMWPMMTSLASDAFEGNGFGRALGILATSSRAGAILGNMIFGPLSASVSWQTLYYISCGTAAVALGTFKTSVYPLPLKPTLASEASSDAPSDGIGNEASVAAPTAKPASEPVPYAAAMSAFVRSPRVWLVFFCQTMMTMGMECQALLPLYLQQGANLSAAAAGAMAAVFPLGAAAATVATGAVFDKVTGLRRAAMFGVENLVAVGALGMLARAPTKPNAAVLVAIMVGVAPTFYIPSANFVTRFAGDDYKGTLMSYMDIPGQLANILFMSIYPTLLARGGWGLVFRALQITILSGAAALAVFLTLDAKSPTRVFNDKRLDN
jgi:MFS family permease